MDEHWIAREKEIQNAGQEEDAKCRSVDHSVYVWSRSCRLALAVNVYLKFWDIDIFFLKG
jgi:hypothetical protein